MECPVRFEACHGKITQIEIERETEKSVWVDGQRRDKNGGWHPVFESRLEAKKHIVDKAKAELEAAAGRVAFQTRKLREAEAL